jgi:2-keto-4-pentenoate hydratase
METEDEQTLLRLGEMAQRLTDSRQRLAPIELLSQQGPLSLIDAHEIQRMVITDWCVDRKTQVIGYKIGLTSYGAQQRLRTNQPTYGLLLEERCLPTPATVSLSSMLASLIEPVLVFLFCRDLPPYASAQEIIDATLIAPGMELPESRYDSWSADTNLTLEDFVADNVAAGTLVVGEGIPTTEVDLEEVRVTLGYEGRQIADGKAGNVLGDPLRAVSWLSRQLALRDEVIPAGAVVSSGSLCGPCSLRSGTYTAIFRDMGSVTCRVGA